MFFLSPLISSCAGAPTSERGFAAPPDSVRASVRRSLAGYADVRLEEGRFVTGWSAAAPTGREHGPLLGHEYRYRARHEVTVDGSTVSISTQAERRAAGGPRSLRWERVDPASFRDALLDEVEKNLEGSR